MGDQAPGGQTRGGGRHPGRHRQRPRARPAGRIVRGEEVGTRFEVPRVGRIVEPHGSRLRNPRSRPARQSGPPRALARLLRRAERTPVCSRWPTPSARHQEDILAANAHDVDAARATGLSGAMIDRLRLDETRLAAMADGIRAVAALARSRRRNAPRVDPPQRHRDQQGPRAHRRRGHHLRIPPQRHQRRRRPLHENGQRRHPARRQRVPPFQPRHRRCPARRRGPGRVCPPTASCSIPRTDREAVRHLAEMDQVRRLLVPRGGQSLIEAVVQPRADARHQALPRRLHPLRGPRRRPGHGGQTSPSTPRRQRPGVCNAVETLLVHRDIAADLPAARRRRPLGSAASNCAAITRSAQILGERVVPATEADWTTEFLDLRLAVNVVGDLDEAVEHIETHGSHHSDAIVTADADSRRAVPQRGGFSDGLLERQHAVHGRRGVRVRRGDRHQHGQTPRARSDGTGGIDHVQIRHPGHRTGADIDLPVSPWVIFCREAPANCGCSPRPRCRQRRRRRRRETPAA